MVNYQWRRLRVHAALRTLTVHPYTYLYIAANYHVKVSWSVGSIRTMRSTHTHHERVMLNRKRDAKLGSPSLPGGFPDKYATKH